jgi:hypothetical protein
VPFGRAGAARVEGLALDERRIAPAAQADAHVAAPADGLRGPVFTEQVVARHVEIVAGRIYSVTPNLVRSSAMNAPLLPEVLLGIDSSQEPQLPLACEGVLRYVRQGRFGAMLIEVKDGVALVNGQRVEPHVAPAQPAT